MAKRKPFRMNRDFLEQLERVRIEIEELCDTAGVRPTALAKMAGVRPSTVNKVLDREKPIKYLPKESTLKKLRVAVDEKRQHNDRHPVGVPRLEGRSGRPHVWDLPIRASRDEGGNLMFKKTGHYGLARRPGTLVDVVESYAIRIVDDAHSRRYEPGWLAHVNATLPLVPGKDLVVRLLDDTAVVGELVQETPSSLVLRQFNRKEHVAILRTNIRTAHRIVGSDQE